MNIEQPPSIGDCTRPTWSHGGIVCTDTAADQRFHQIRVNPVCTFKRKILSWLVFIISPFAHPHLILFCISCVMILVGCTLHCVLLHVSHVQMMCSTVLNVAPYHQHQLMSNEQNCVRSTRPSWFRLQIKLNMDTSCSRTCCAHDAEMRGGTKCVNAEAAHSHPIYSKFRSFIHRHLQHVRIYERHDSASNILTFNKTWTVCVFV